MSALPIVSVKFKWGEKTYDYYAPFPVEVGQRVYVPTNKGETKAEVVEFKTESDRVEKSILRVVEENHDLRTEAEKSASHPNGSPIFSMDRTMLDEHGNRSIFDDIDK